MSGDISRSIAINASLVWAPASAWNTAETRSSARPLRSSATIVLAKLGVSRQAAMASISAIWPTMAQSNAGLKCSGRIAGNGGVSSGGVHSPSRGLLWSWEPFGVAVGGNAVIGLSGPDYGLSDY